MNTRRFYPQAGQTYSLSQIFEMDLDDNPSLGFIHQDKLTCIQDSHLEVPLDKAVPGIGNTMWKYIRTTNEWIPVFRAEDDHAILEFVDIEAEFLAPYAKNDVPGWWVTPKGFPREQYYDPKNPWTQDSIDLYKK